MDEFKPIKDYETYSINKDGIIKDLRFGRIIKPYIDKQGYHKVNLRNPKGQGLKSIHKLVALNFIDNVDNKETVDHIDRNKNNNNVNNLRWANMLEQAENKGNFKNNKLNEKYICYEEGNRCCRYRIQINRNGKNLIRKSFPTSIYTLDDVIEYRNNFMKENNII